MTDQKPVRPAHLAKPYAEMTEIEMKELETFNDTERQWERNQKIAETKRLIKIVNLLGYTPTNDAIKDNKTEKYIYNAYATGEKDQNKIYLRAGDYNHIGKVNIGGSYPTVGNGDNHYRQVPDSINISMTKTNEQIAEQIKTRFLTTFEIEGEYIKKENAAATDKTTKEKNIIKKLAGIMNLEIENGRYMADREKGKSARIHNGMDYTLEEIKISTSYRSVKWEIETDWNTAEKIAEAIKDIIKNAQKKEI